MKKGMPDMRMRSDYEDLSHSLYDEIKDTVGRRGYWKG